jgi:anti-sigma28 factor (negative regulator of flagellin synthesis)
MKIDPTRSRDLHSKAPDGGPEQEGATAADKPTAAARTDQVEISDRGRALASEAEALGVQQQPLTPARIDEIQAKLESGYYDQPDIVQETAERLADSGDL